MYPLFYRAHVLRHSVLWHLCSASSSAALLYRFISCLGNCSCLETLLHLDTGASALDKRSAKAHKAAMLAKLGASAEKRPRIPAKMGLGMAKKAKQREAVALQEAIAAGMVKAKGRGKKQRAGKGMCVCVCVCVVRAVRACVRAGGRAGVPTPTTAECMCKPAAVIDIASGASGGVCLKRRHCRDAACI